ncbi:hypothetical protein J3A78_002335 [Streptomyces sp. PvR006]|uniref:hypothetical protein n=1 Tax=Streptomyces sp. PvR006 TaxID=2817860 RepID=UPI001AEB58EE|nr:hypothetical protein [Streptomyces sp. PvR006]MBP2581857.1 hypothetical protein [Streptomyces sp. PvR006]
MTTPACAPTTSVAGDMLCLDYECDHDRNDGEYCAEVAEERICDTHSTTVAAESGWGEITHAEPWPCQYDKAVAS